MGDARPRTKNPDLLFPIKLTLERTMSGGIFLIQSDGQLVEMKEQLYDTEAVLQELLAKYPNLLAGDQMDGTAPRRWLLISREMGVPDDEEEVDPWSLDHLFLDQVAIPTLVEVKRSSDTRIRREVVGQMLDYAANAVAYWPVEAVRARFEEACRQRGADPTKEIETLIGLGSDPDGFWQRVKTNLQAGRVRMVFVADVIPPELRRIVEFLNGQMDPAEVLAVEIKQFVGQGLKTLVPRVIGLTVAAKRREGGSDSSTSTTSATPGITRFFSRASCGPSRRRSIRCAWSVRGLARQKTAAASGATPTSWTPSRTLTTSGTRSCWSGSGGSFDPEEFDPAKATKAMRKGLPD